MRRGRLSTPDRPAVWTICSSSAIGRAYSFLDAGLVNRVLPAADLDDAVARAAERLARGPQHAVRGVKRLLRRSPGATMSSQLAAEAASFGACAGTDDFAEGVRAFLEKRPASFGRKAS